MANLNQRGQILIESIFVVLSVASLLIMFQMMIDHQRKEISKDRLSKSRKDIIYVPKNENFEAK